MAELATLLDTLSLSHLAPRLADTKGLYEILKSQGRPALLSHLKALGLALPERQKVAGAIAKFERDAASAARPSCPPASLQPPTCSSTWVQWTNPPGGCSEQGWANPYRAQLPPLHPHLSQVIVLDSVLTDAECARLVQRAEQEVGFEMSRHQGARDEGFRRGRRALLTDGGLAAEIFARIARWLPSEPLQMDAANATSTDGTDTEAASELPPPAAASSSSLPEWGPAVALWEQLRVLSYDNGDFFLPHRDNACSVGHSSFHPHCRSFYSILIYLADSEDGGGATRFYCGGDVDDGMDADVGRPLERGQEDGEAQQPALQQPALHAKNARRPVRGTVADVVPWAGRAVIFPHKMLHESMPIAQGRKYVVRGDILFRPSGPDPMDHVALA